MKTRSGFVSNSSSSSFIIGLGIASDQNAIKKLRDIEAKDWQVQIIPLVDVFSLPEYDSSRDTFSIESFDYTTETLLDIEKAYLKNNDAVIVRLNVYGGDESDFVIYDEDGDFVDYDYDIDLDHFRSDELGLLEDCKKLSDEGTFTFSYGAGRDG